MTSEGHTRREGVAGGEKREVLEVFLVAKTTTEGNRLIFGVLLPGSPWQEALTSSKMFKDGAVLSRKITMESERCVLVRTYGKGIKKEVTFFTVSQSRSYK